MEMLLVWIDINMWVYYCTVSFSWSVFTFLGVHLPAYTVLDPLHDQYVNVPILQATAPWYSTTIQYFNCTAVVVCCYSVCITFCVCTCMIGCILICSWYSTPTLLYSEYPCSCKLLLCSFISDVALLVLCLQWAWRWVGDLKFDTSTRYKCDCSIYSMYCLIRLNAISSDKFALAAQLVRARRRHLYWCRCWYVVFEYVKVCNWLLSY